MLSHIEKDEKPLDIFIEKNDIHFQKLIRVGTKYLIVATTKAEQRLIWDLEKQKFISTINLHNDLFGIPDDDNHFFQVSSVKSETQINLWNIEQPNAPLKKITLPTANLGWPFNHFSEVAALPDKNHFLRIECYRFNDHRIVLYNFDSNKPIKTFSNQKLFKTALCVLPDGKRFVSGLSHDSETSKLCLWNIDQSEPVAYFKIPGISYSNIEQIIYLKNKQQIIAILDKDIYLWNMNDEKPIAIFKSPYYAGECLDLIILPGEQHFVAHYASGIWIWTIPAPSSTTQICDETSMLGPTWLSDDFHASLGSIFLDNQGRLFYNRYLYGENIQLLQATSTGITFTDPTKKLPLFLDKKCDEKREEKQTEFSTIQTPLTEKTVTTSFVRHLVLAGLMPSQACKTAEKEFKNIIDLNKSLILKTKNKISFEHTLTMGTSYLLLWATETNSAGIAERSCMAWDISKKEFLYRINTSTSSESSFIMVPHDENIFLEYDRCCGKDAKLNLWDVRKPNAPVKTTLIPSKPERPTLILLKDNHHFLISNNDRPILRNFDTQLNTKKDSIHFHPNYNAHEARIIKKYYVDGHFTPSTLHLLPDGEHFIGGIVSENTYAHSSKYPRLCLWNIFKSDQPVAYFSFANTVYSKINQIVYLKEKKQILGVGYESIYLWDIKGGNPIAIFKCPMKDDYIALHDIIVLPGERQFVAHYNSGIWVWTIPSASKQLTTQQCSKDSTLAPEWISDDPNAGLGATFLDKFGSVYYSKGCGNEQGTFVELFKITPEGLSFNGQVKRLALPERQEDLICYQPNIFERMYNTISGLFYTPKYAPSMVEPPEALLALPAPNDIHKKEEEKVIGHGTEHSTFLNPTPETNIIVATILGKCYWTSMKKLDENDIKRLHKQQEIVNSLEDKFAEKSKSNSVKYQDTKTLLRDAQYLIKEALDNNKISRGDLHDIPKKIKRIQENLPLLKDTEHQNDNRNVAPREMFFSSNHLLNVATQPQINSSSELPKVGHK